MFLRPYFDWWESELQAAPLQSVGRGDDTLGHKTGFFQLVQNTDRDA